VNLKRNLRLSVLLLAVVGLAACNNSYGVFSSIQEESKNTSTSTFYQTLVPDLVVYGSNYYARLVGIYSRPTSSAAASGWEYLDESSFGSDYVCRGMAVTSAGLYVAISNGRGATSTPNGIYLLNGGTWNKVYSATENIQALYAAHDVLFVVTMDTTSDSGSTYSLRYLSGTLTATEITGVSAIPTNVVYFSVNSSFYCASGTKLYSANPGPTGFSTVVTAPSVKITRLATDAVPDTDSATALFIGSSTGYVYRSVNGTTWPESKLATYSTSYGVVSMTAVPWKADGSGRALLVGSSYVGYYEADVTSGLGSFTTGDSSNIVAAESNYDSSLGNMPVMSFVYSGTTTSGVLFACASAMAVDYTGLWSNKRSSNAWASGWASE